MKKVLLSVLIILSLHFALDCVFAETTVSEVAVSWNPSLVFPIYETEENFIYTVNWENIGNAEKSINAAIYNYNEEKVFENTYSVSSDASSYEFTIENTLSPGHYTLIVSVDDKQDETMFAIVPSSRRDSSELGIGIASMSITSSIPYKKDNFDEYLDTIKKAGIYFTREYANMNSFFPLYRGLESEENRPFELWQLERFDYLVNRANEKGIRLTLMYQQRQQEDVEMGFTTEGYNIPDDLLKSYKLAYEFAKRYGGKADIIEVFNEVSGSTFPKDTADKYAAFFKASAIGIKDGLNETGQTARISPSAISNSSADYDYTKKLLENDISEYSDIFNKHYYHIGYTDQNNNQRIGISKYDERLMNLLNGYGFENRAVVVTEQGMHIPRGVDLDGNYLSEMTSEQEKLLAQYGPTSLIETLAMGADEAIWWINGAFEEGIYLLGNMTNSGEPCRVYSSISAMTNALGNGKYYGSFNNMPSNIDAHVFVEGSDSIGCFWSNTVDTEVSVPVPSGCTSATLTDIMGNETIVYPDNLTNIVSLTATRDIQYLRINTKFDDNNINIASKKSITVSDDLTKAERIVLQPRFNDLSFENAKNNGYAIDANGTEFILRVYNFNDTPVNGKVNIDVSNGWVSSVDMQEVTVEPMDFTDVTVKVTPKNVVNNTSARIRFSGVFDGNICSDAISHIICNDTQLVSGYDKAENWTANFQGYGQNNTAFSMEGIGDGVIKFNYEIPDSSKWAYPYLTVPEDLDFTKADRICFMFKANQPVSSVRVYFDEYKTESAQKGEMYTAGIVPTGYEDWQYAEILFDNLSFYHFEDNLKLDLDNIEKIQIGFNLPSDASSNIEFCLKNVMLMNGEGGAHFDIPSKVGEVSECRKAENWADKHNTFSFSNEPDGSIKFDYDLNYDWAYPKLTIPEGLPFSSGDRIAFKFKGSQTLSAVGLFIVEESGERHSCFITPTASTDWQYGEFLYDDFKVSETNYYVDGVLNVDKIAHIEIGFNIPEGASKEIDFYLKDISIKAANSGDTFIQGVGLGDAVDGIQPFITRVQNYRRGKVSGEMIIILKNENALQYMSVVPCEVEANSAASFSIDVPVEVVNKATKAELYFWNKFVPVSEKSCTDF
ncbi:MAG: hypothetical protein IKW64_04330 [Clostridia bacterium]|nr:hypothetical protein [Clostridia bacterium]